MLIKIENSVHNGHVETRYVNSDHILFIEKQRMGDLTCIALDVSRGEKNDLARIYVKLSSEDLVKYINEALQNI